MDNTGKSHHSSMLARRIAVREKSDGVQIMHVVEKLNKILDEVEHLKRRYQ